MSEFNPREGQQSNFIDESAEKQRAAEIQELMRQLQEEANHEADQSVASGIDTWEHSLPSRTHVNAETEIDLSQMRRSLNFRSQSMSQTLMSEAFHQNIKLAVSPSIKNIGHLAERLNKVMTGETSKADRTALACFLQNTVKPEEYDYLQKALIEVSKQAIHFSVRHSLSELSMTAQNTPGFGSPEAIYLSLKEMNPEYELCSKIHQIFALTEKDQALGVPQSAKNYRDRAIQATTVIGLFGGMEYFFTHNGPMGGLLCLMGALGVLARPHVRRIRNNYRDMKNYDDLLDMEKSIKAFALREATQRFKTKDAYRASQTMLDAVTIAVGISSRDISYARKQNPVPTRREFHQALDSLEGALHAESFVPEQAKSVVKDLNTLRDARSAIFQERRYVIYTHERPRPVNQVAAAYYGLNTREIQNEFLLVCESLERNYELIKNEVVLNNKIKSI